MTLCRLLYVVMYSHDVKSSCLLPVLWVVKYSHDVKFACALPVFVCCEVQSRCEMFSLPVFVCCDAGFCVL